MLAEFLQRRPMCQLPKTYRKEKFKKVSSPFSDTKKLSQKIKKVESKSQAESVACSTFATYFGHGVIFDTKSSTASVMPRTSKQLPRPFHSVVTPCRWCRCTITGTSVNGIKWCRCELWCTWHCRRSTTNGWLSRFSVIRLTKPTLTPKYLRIDWSSSRSGLSYVGWTFRCFCNGSRRSPVDCTYL